MENGEWKMEKKEGRMDKLGEEGKIWREMSEERFWLSSAETDWNERISWRNGRRVTGCNRGQRR